MYLYVEYLLKSIDARVFNVAQKFCKYPNTSNKFNFEIYELERIQNKTAETRLTPFYFLLINYTFDVLDLLSRLIIDQ